jgi:hypothetical protein
MNGPRQIRWALFAITVVAMGCCGVAEFARIQMYEGASRSHVGILTNSATVPLVSRFLPLSVIDPDTAVKSGRDSLESPAHFPWYDAQKDDLRPVDLRVDDDSSSAAGKGGRPGGKGRSGGNLSGRGGSGSGNGSNGGRESGSPDEPESSPSIDPSAVSAPALMWIAWIAIGAVLMWIVYMLIRAFLDREAKDAKQSDSHDADDKNDSAPLDALPSRVVPAKGGLLEEARRQYEAGNYNAAIVYLYSYELLKLDQNQMLRLARGKTNREYLRELAGRPELYSILAQSLVPFEDVYFGEHELNRERFEACWNQVDRFHRLIEQAAT